MFMFNTAAILETRPHHEMYLGNESFVLVETGMSDNGDGNARTAMITETTTLHVHHSLLCISSPSLHDYKVKCLISRFVEDVNEDNDFPAFSFPEEGNTVFLSICQHLTI